MKRYLNRSSHGFALAASMLITMLLAGISVGMVYLVNTESRLSATDMENTSVYYGAEAAMEKMMSDLSNLYTAQLAPTVAEIEALAGSSFRPNIAGITYPDYSFIVPQSGGNPITETRTISAGPNEGLLAYIIKMTLSVTAAGVHGAEVKMEREVEVALIPVFQFGIFSDTDLAYFPGPGFDFGGRVHTNGHLFFGTSGSGIYFHNKITIVDEAIRMERANGLPMGTGPVFVPTAPAGCDGAQPACRDLQETEGSKLAGPTSADNVNWADISLSTYNGLILNGDTGAKPLDLPFVAPGLRAIEIIRRPPAGEDSSSLVGQSRFFNMAQLRVVISDAVAENPGNTGVRLTNVAPYYDGVTYGNTDTAFAEADDGVDGDFVRPGAVPTGTWPLVDGFLRVQALQGDGTYLDVTTEWLDLGIARENPDAILKFQGLKDNNNDGTPDYADTAANRSDPLKMLKLSLYDAREGEVRDVDLGSSDTTCAIGGIIDIVELDVGNLKRWLDGATGSTGAQTENASQNGYILYFSDRRGMLPDPGPGVKLGEYGFEDIVNPPVAAGTPDATYHDAEDVNENGTLETYGGANLGDGFGVANNDPTIRIDCPTIGRKNRASGARRGLKLINGSLGNVPTRPGGAGGFTVAAEGGVYIEGHYNADAAGYGNPHASSAVIADAVMFLSKDWEDWRSFRYPSHRNQRVADDTYYRVAIASGKNKNWPHPTGWTTKQSYGQDGGVHNFLRYLERWSSRNFNYRGSLVSLYYSEYHTGIFKCCSAVYGAPTRNYEFDTDFLDLSKLPPGTPRFRDVVNLGYRQIMTPE